MAAERMGLKQRYIRDYAYSTLESPLKIGLAEITNPDSLNGITKSPSPGRGIKQALYFFEIITGVPTNVFYYRYLRGRIEQSGQAVRRAGICFEADRMGLLESI